MEATSRHLTRPHQPAAPCRDPARLAPTSRRNNTVTTNAPNHALHQDHHTCAGCQPRPDPDSGPASGKISFTRLSPPPEPSRFLHHHNRAKREIPIGHRRSPAGSCLGGFRTPAPTHRRDLRWPASENLHQSGGCEAVSMTSGVGRKRKVRFGQLAGWSGHSPPRLVMAGPKALGCGSRDGPRGNFVSFGSNLDRPCRGVSFRGNRP
jgi:hypothetical protein